jgi:hypothetical protein
MHTYEECHGTGGAAATPTGIINMVVEKSFSSNAAFFELESPPIQAPFRYGILVHVSFLEALSPR